jgi:precorrin-4 methylase
VTDFKAASRALTKAGVEFIVVGGVAATVPASARLTRDIDVVYRRTSSNIDRVVTHAVSSCRFAGMLRPFAAA